MRVQLTKYLTQTNIPNIILCTVVYVVLWLLPIFIGSTGYRGDDVIQTLFLQKFALWEITAQTASILGMIAWALILIGIHMIAIKHAIIPVRTMMPLVVGGIIVSTIDGLHYFDQRHIALILLLFALDEMMSLYDFKLQIKSAFNVALLLGLASLFEPLYSWLLMLFIIGLSVYRVVTWRTLTSLVIGLMLVVYTAFGIAWLTDNIEIMTCYATKIIDFGIPNFKIWRLTDVIIVMIIAVLWVFTLANYVAKRGSYNLNLRLNAVFINWSFVYTAIVCLFGGIYTQHIILAPLTLIILGASILYTGSQDYTTNISFIILTVLLVAYRVFWTLGF